MEGMDLWMKRDDLIHPIISGNKWRKLKGFFREIDRSKTIITFGGAYSNHLPAAALAVLPARGISACRTIGFS